MIVTKDASRPVAWITIQDFASRADVSIRTVRRRIASGDLQARRFGPRLIRIPASELDGMGTPIGIR